MINQNRGNTGTHCFEFENVFSGRVAASVNLYIVIHQLHNTNCKTNIIRYWFYNWCCEVDELQ